MKNNLPSIPGAQIPKELLDHWPKVGGQAAVFLAQFSIPAGHASNTGKTALKAALFSGVGTAGEYGPAIEYVVVEMTGKTHREHRLAQGGKSVAYQSKQESEREDREAQARRTAKMTPDMRELIEFGAEVMSTMEQLTGATNCPDAWNEALLKEYKAAGEPKAKKKWLGATLAPRLAWISHRPRWAQDEGEWCFIAGKPMIFLGQTAVPEGGDTPEDAPAGEMVYLFFDQTASGREFKVIAQECGEQTADDHYRLEEQITRFHQLGGGPQAANELVEKGDLWAHRFLLDRADLTKPTLQLLMKHGANRQIKEEAKARLVETR